VETSVIPVALMESLETYDHLAPGATRATADRLDNATGRNLHASAAALR